MEALDNFFWVPFVAIGAFILYRFIKYGGFRGALYGSTVTRTVGEVELTRSLGASTTLRVHVLENGQIILEQSSRALVAASVSGMPLTAAQADALISLLQQARS